MEIISGQQKGEASGSTGYEFSLYSYCSLQFFQLLENKNGRWGEVTQSYLGVVGFSRSS